MAIKDILAAGVGFAPNGPYLLVTKGYGAGIANIPPVVPPPPAGRVADILALRAGRAIGGGIYMAGVGHDRRLPPGRARR